MTPRQKPHPIADAVVTVIARTFGGCIVMVPMALVALVLCAATNVEITWQSLACAVVIYSLVGAAVDEWRGRK